MTERIASSEQGMEKPGPYSQFPTRYSADANINQRTVQTWQS